MKMNRKNMIFQSQGLGDDSRMGSPSQGLRKLAQTAANP